MGTFTSSKSGYIASERRPTRTILVGGERRQIVVRPARSNARRAAIREQLAGAR
ncbi:hypothetical protein [Rhizomonospora bruguierae]|uniref:hypothetical protein n=1 Tax=Rhizomonospora bruguierae TaxID=1581705 RepID=UPI001BD1AED2|nr:hypothetical protein [Micromonospora sp. NBRC 107566]